MEEGSLRGAELDAAAEQLGVERREREVVAGDDLRRKRHGIAGRQHHMGMAVKGDAGHGAARFALTAGADIHDPVAGQEAGLTLVDQVGNMLQVAVLAGCAEKPVQRAADQADMPPQMVRSEEHTSELQSLMRISYAVFCLKKKK